MTDSTHPMMRESESLLKGQTWLHSKAVSVLKPSNNRNIEHISILISIFLFLYNGQESPAHSSKKKTKGKERKEADQSDNTKVNLEFPLAYRNV